jgi:hypothetical protein
MTTDTKRVLTVLAAVIIIGLIFPFECTDTQAQTGTTFTPSDKFSIHTLNGTISFAVNGSYTSAQLVNDNWIFTNLRLNNSQPLGNLTISTKDSNITIFSFRSNPLFRQSATLRYNAQGAGTQNVNFNLNLTQTQPLEWTVTVPTVPGIRSGFLAEGDNWNLLPNNSVVIYGLTGNISISHFTFFVPPPSNQPFYVQHSIIIITTIVLSILVAVTVVIHVKVRSSKE